LSVDWPCTPSPHLSTISRFDRFREVNKASSRTVARGPDVLSAGSRLVGDGPHDLAHLHRVARRNLQQRYRPDIRPTRSRSQARKNRRSALLRPRSRSARADYPTPPAWSKKTAGPGSHRAVVHPTPWQSGQPPISGSCCATSLQAAPRPPRQARPCTWRCPGEGDGWPCRQGCRTTPSPPP
jgi:hypothetical protein